jgi:hypothetical protein
MNEMIRIVILRKCCVETAVPIAALALVRAHRFEHDLAANSNDVNENDGDNGKFCKEVSVIECKIVVQKNLYDTDAGNARCAASIP